MIWLLDTQVDFLVWLGWTSHPSTCLSDLLPRRLDVCHLLFFFFTKVTREMKWKKTQSDLMSHNHSIPLSGTQTFSVTEVPGNWTDQRQCLWLCVCPAPQVGCRISRTLPGVGNRVRLYLQTEDELLTYQLLYRRTYRKLSSTLYYDPIVDQMVKHLPAMQET